MFDLKFEKMILRKLKIRLFNFMSIYSSDFFRMDEFNMKLTKLIYTD